MIEIWRDICGYEGLYKVSNYGRIKSLSKRVVRGFCEVVTKEKIMTLQRCKSKGNGFYVQVTLSKDGIQKSHRIHRLVAHAFLKRKSGCNQVDHIDGNKENNKLDNLRWVSQTGNINNPVTKYASKTLCKIRCESIDGCFVKEYPSLTMASLELGIPISSISCIINNTSGMNGRKLGYTFKRIQ